MAKTKGAYVTRGRGLELERQIEQVRRDLGERIAAAEARAEAAERRCNDIITTILNARRKVA